MPVPIDLNSLSLAVAGEMKQSNVAGPACQMASELMEIHPEAAIDLIDLLLKAAPQINAPSGKRRKTGGAAKGGRKQSQPPIEGYLYLLVNALEVIRYGVERKKAAPLKLLERIRTRLLEAGRRSREDPQALEPRGLMMILSQFAIARLDLGDELRAMMDEFATVPGEQDGEIGDPLAEMSNSLAEMSQNFDGDSFALYDFLAQMGETLPEEMRAFVAGASLIAGDGKMREAALGWLTSNSATVRQAALTSLALAPGKDIVTSVMLRRMIAMRNWLPEAERPALDSVIRELRQKKLACASWPKAKVLETHASGVDGSGCQSILAIVSESRKRAVAGALVKHGVGVVDAWVARGLSVAEAREICDSAGRVSGSAAVDVDYVAKAIPHFLGLNAQSGGLPPFGLLDFAESAGVTDVTPEITPVERLVEQMCAELDEDDLSPAKVKEILEGSAQWPVWRQQVDSWFLDDEDIATQLKKKGLTPAKRKTLLLSGPLQERRSFWAQVIAWTAFTMKHERPTNHEPDGGSWREFAIVARELLGERPLKEFGIMQHIANTTISAHGPRR